MKKRAYIGLDVHKNSITMAMFAGNSKQEDFVIKLPNDRSKLIRQIKKLTKDYHVKVAYEAGGCGYSIYRHLAKAGIECMVVAPSLIPEDRKRIKTDKRDALKLANYLRAGLLTPVNVVDEDLEQDRDLIRFRESRVKEQTRVKQYILSFLLRKGIQYDEPGNWSQGFMNWLRNLELPVKDKLLLNRYVAHYQYNKSLVQELDLEIEELSQTDRYRGLAMIIRAFRGLNTLTAMTILTHVPDLRSFHSPAQLSSYVGITPAESSSGDSVRRGSITKTGSNLLRKALTIAAQQYTKPDRIGYATRQKRRDLSPAMTALIEKADRRCRKRYCALTAQGKHTNKAKVAVARELVSFIWEAAMIYNGGEVNEVA